MPVALSCVNSWRVTLIQASVLFLTLMSAALSISVATGNVFPTLAVTPCVLALVLLVQRPWPSRGLHGGAVVSRASASELLLIVTVLVTVAWLIGWTYSGPSILPVHDPIAIPVLAAHYAAGELPAQIYPKGSFGHAYPSGAPLLFASVWAAVSPGTALMLLKYLTLVALALIPASWAWLLHRSLSLPIRFAPWLALCYLAFWGLERTIGFALPYAGKTALIWSLALCPLLVSLMQDFAHRGGPWRWLVGGLALFGLIMMNYSMAHLVAACLAGLWLASFDKGRSHWLRGLQLGAMLALAAGLVLLLMREATSDPRAGGFQFEPWLRLQYLVQIFLDRTTPVVIFHNTDEGFVQPTFRGAWQLLAWAVAWVVATTLKLHQLRRALTACLLIIAFILLAGFGVVPAGITLDYARWIVWPVQALSFAIVLTIATAAWRQTQGWRSWVFASTAVVGVVTAATLVMHDAPLLKRTVRSDAVQLRDLMREADWLQAQAGKGPCLLIAESHLTGDNLSVYYTGRIYSYVSQVSPCRVINGSWVDQGVPAARAWNGLASAEHLRATVPAGAALLLIGPAHTMEPYVEKLRDAGLNPASELLRASGPSSVWRVHLAPR